jgi:hypothetical protein
MAIHITWRSIALFPVQMIIGPFKFIGLVWLFFLESLLQVSNKWARLLITAIAIPIAVGGAYLTYSHEQNVTATTEAMQVVKASIVMPSSCSSPEIFRPRSVKEVVELPSDRAEIKVSVGESPTWIEYRRKVGESPLVLRYECVDTREADTLLDRLRKAVS